MTQQSPERRLRRLQGKLFGGGRDLDYAEMKEALFLAGGFLKQRDQAQAEIQRLGRENARARLLLEPLADNSLADDPVWCARFALEQWHWAELDSAPEWFKEGARAALEQADERQWDEQFATSEEALKKLAEEALQEYREGKTLPLDPDRLGKEETS